MLKNLTEKFRLYSGLVHPFLWKQYIPLKICLLAVLVSISLFCSAQTPWYPPPRKSPNKAFIEVFGGASIPTIKYSEPKYAAFDPAVMLRPIAGVSFRYQLMNILSLAPQISYSGQGVKLPTHLNYQLNASYISFQLPLEFYISQAKDQCCFASLAPFIGFPVAGDVSINGYETKLSQANIADKDFGLELGIGYRFPTFSVSGKSFVRIKLAYMLGLNNTYSPMEIKGEAIALNQPFYTIDGERKNRGIRLTIGIDLPMTEQKVSTFVAGGTSDSSYKKFVIQRK